MKNEDKINEMFHYNICNWNILLSKLPDRVKALVYFDALGKFQPIL